MRDDPFDPAVACYAIVQEGDRSDRGLLVGIGADGIRYITAGCSATILQLLRRFTDFLLPPTP